MKHPHQIDIYDEALRVTYLDQAKSWDADKDASLANTVFDTWSSATMDAGKRRMLLDKLQHVMKALSFGELLEASIQKAGLSEQVIAEKSGLAQNVIRELREDAVYVNSIPVMFFKNLLSALQIAVKPARQAINKTFEILQHQVLNHSQGHAALAPAYRKGYYVSRESALKTAAASDGRELFENKEALDRYLDCLEELMDGEQQDNKTPQ